MTVIISGDTGIDTVGSNTVGNGQLIDGSVQLAKLGFTPPFTKAFVSTPQTWVAGASLTLPHELGSPPTLFQFYMQCVTADGGYATGDIVKVSEATDNNTTTNGYGLQIYNPNTTNILGRWGNTGICSALTHKTTGAIYTPNSPNWRLVIRAWA